MNNYPFLSRLKFSQTPGANWRAFILTLMMWVALWSLSFAQGDGPIPEIITINYPTEIGSADQPFDIEIWVSNVGNETAKGGSITLSVPEGHEISIVDADVPILPNNHSDCAFSDPHARVLGPDSVCNEGLEHNTACQGTVNLQYPMAEAWRPSWAAAQEQYMRVRVFPKPDASFVTVYVRAAFLSEEGSCNLILEPNDLSGQAVDQQGFPVYTEFIELVLPATEVVPTETPSEATLTPTEEPLIEPTATQEPVIEPTATQEPVIEPTATQEPVI